MHVRSNLGGLGPISVFTSYFARPAPRGLARAPAVSTVRPERRGPLCVGVRRDSGEHKGSCPLLWALGTGTCPGGRSNRGLFVQCSTLLAGTKRICMHHVRNTNCTIRVSPHRSRILAFKFHDIKMRDKILHFILLALLILSVLSHQINDVKFQFLMFCYRQRHQLAN